MLVLPKGVRHIPGCLSTDDQRALVEDIRRVVATAPLFTPRMPRTGKEMSVRMTNCGSLGWVTDKERGFNGSVLADELAEELDDATLHRVGQGVHVRDAKHVVVAVVTLRVEKAAE